MSTPARGILDRLRDRIVRGEIEPGSPMRQEILAADLGVSRLPVRDALTRLEAEGLVEVRPDRGAYVTAMSAAECVELFDLRILLECDALGHAIPNHTARTVRRARAAQAELETEDETPRWVEGDRRFHELLYEPGGRPRTLQFIRTLRNVVDRFYLARLTHGVRREAWKAEHRRLLKAVEGRDVDRARACLAEHLRETRRVVLAALTAGPDASQPRRPRPRAG
jgi:DNA-binding GntR family transcriptional regulator